MESDGRKRKTPEKVSFSRPALPYPPVARLELELRSGEPGRITGFLGRTTGESGRHIAGPDQLTGGPGGLLGTSQRNTADLDGSTGALVRTTTLLARRTFESDQITGGLSRNTTERQGINAPSILGDCE